MASGGRRLRVGIVGSGMAGSACAYFLRQALGSEADLVVYERNAAVGGRVHEVTVAGHTVAAGASVAHSANQCLLRFVAALGLHPERHAPRTIGVWNGSRFDFRTTGTRWLDTLRALGRYGLPPCGHSVWSGTL